MGRIPLIAVQPPNGLNHKVAICIHTDAQLSNFVRAVKWCHGTIQQDDWSCDYKGRFCFKHEDDALLFQLTWG